METKNFSRLICEECRIKPIEQLFCHWECKDEKIGLFCNIKDCKYSRNNANFPDFKNNNNFVKLLELKILTGCTLWGFLSLKGVYMSQKETVLKTIYLILSNKIKFLDDYAREQIKQSIRQEKWEV